MARGESYEEFTEKFKPKKTTDDCLTPTGVWTAVASWVASEYGRDPGTFVRPFWPGGDYEAYDYPPGCTVVDNPPFSILSAILRFYVERRIDFFLFAPTLTLFTGWSLGLCYVPVGNQITYANGANVNTSYVTSLEPGTRLRTAPKLYKAVKRANKENVKATTKTLPKYVFPDAVISAAQIYKYSRLGIDFRVAARDCCYISGLDAMRERRKGSGIFGGGAAAVTACGGGACGGGACGGDSMAVIGARDRHGRGAGQARTNLVFL